MRVVFIARGSICRVSLTVFNFFKKVKIVDDNLDKVDFFYFLKKKKFCVIL